MLGLFLVLVFYALITFANRSFDFQVEAETDEAGVPPVTRTRESFQSSLASEGIPGVRMIGMPTARERFEQRIRIDQEMRNPNYEARVSAMDKVTLLDEMIRFQDEQMKTREPSREQLIRGRILFQALLRSAETDELRKLSGDYKTRLEDEYKSNYWAG
ncbi:MAG: hypothetical protein KGP28_10725 [Bdellovibrionales bacterium]|nr:hypothetical protein [Bdellovibrionales bacterium]